MGAHQLNAPSGNHRQSNRTQTSKRRFDDVSVPESVPPRALSASAAPTDAAETGAAFNLGLKLCNLTTLPAVRPPPKFDSASNSPSLDAVPPPNHIPNDADASRSKSATTAALLQEHVPNTQQLPLTAPSQPSAPSSAQHLGMRRSSQARTTMRAQQDCFRQQLQELHRCAFLWCFIVHHCTSLYVRSMLVL